MAVSLRARSIAFFTLLAAACSGYDLTQADLRVLGPRVGPVEVQVVFHDFNAPLQAQQTVISDGAAWRVLWEQAMHTRQPRPPLPEVDFARHVVLVAAMGARGTGGYTVTVDRVDRHENGLAAYVTETAPGRSCFTTQAVTHPAIAVKVPRTESVQFAVRQETRECE